MTLLTFKLSKTLLVPLFFFSNALAVWRSAAMHQQRSGKVVPEDMNGKFDKENSRPCPIPWDEGYIYLLIYHKNQPFM